MFLKFRSAFVKFPSAFLLLLSLAGSAAGLPVDTISGRVVNYTRAKASAGDDVILLRLGEGMQEVQRTRSDAQGKFSFPANTSDAGYIVRVLHQGVNYDQKLGGTSSPIEIAVYDAVPKIAGLAGSMGIAQVESDGANLKVTEMYAISNVSNPPVTQASRRNFQMSLPVTAALEAFQVKRAGGVWVNATPSPLGSKGRYEVDFPLRPGDTLFKFVYHLPYQTGTALKVQLAYPVKTFGVVHPPSIVFKSSRSKAFASPGVIKGLQLEQLVATDMIRDVPAFELSGVGTAPSPAQLAQTTAPAVRTEPPPTAATAEATAASPAGEKLGRELWAVVVALAVLLAVGAAFVVRNSRKRRRGRFAALSGQDLRVENLRNEDLRDEEIPDDVSAVDAIRDELSQLETEKLFGEISPEQYDTTKEALNLSLQRATGRHTAATIHK